MNRLSFLLTGWVIALLALTPPIVHAQSRDLQALVQSLNGVASFSTGKGASVVIQPGMRISAGSTIQTGAGAVLDLFLGRGGGVLRLKAGTIVTLEKLSSIDTGTDVQSETRISLSQGEVLGSVNRLPEGASYELWTPDGLAGVQGARFRVRVPGGIQVLNGTLVFVRDNKAHVIKGPGEFNWQWAQPIRALPPAEVPILARQFVTLDAPVQTTQRVRPPVPQQTPLSPTEGR